MSLSLTVTCRRARLPLESKVVTKPKGHLFDPRIRKGRQHKYERGSGRALISESPALSTDSEDDIQCGCSLSGSTVNRPDQAS